MHCSKVLQRRRPEPWRTTRSSGRHKVSRALPNPERDGNVPHSAPQTSTRVEDKRPSGLEDFEHPVSIEQYRSMGYKMVDLICDYYQSVEKYPVRPQVQPGFLRPLLEEKSPQVGQSYESVLEEVERKLMPGVTHWQSPRFFSWYPANTSFPAMLADMMISSLNMIGFSWLASPVGTELEMVMMDWLVDLCQLPSSFLSTSGRGGGVIQGTSSEAVLVALLAAKARTMRGRPPEAALSLVVYQSDQTHSCLKKACMVAGICHVRTLPTTSAHGYALQPEVLSAAIEEDLAAGLIPCYVCATIGTTNVGAIDPVADLAGVTKRLSVWLHVDAAFAGSAAMCEEMRHHFVGLEDVDSYSFNPHKWMLTNFDCCAMWVVDKEPLREALSLTPIYLAGPANILDYKDWQVPLGRSFRSLKLFFVLKMYGQDKLRQYIRHHLALGEYLAECVTTSETFELVSGPRFGLVCFRMVGASEEQHVELVERLNLSGSMLLMVSELEGRKMVRLALGGSRTQLRHVQESWQLIWETAVAVMSSNGNGSQVV